MQAQQNANNLSGEDMNQWLQNVLGINTAYGGALKDQVGVGQGAANQLTDVSKNAATNAGQAAYGQAQGQQNDQNAIWAGIAKMFGG